MNKDEILAGFREVEEAFTDVIQTAVTAGNVLRYAFSGTDILDARVEKAKQTLTTLKRLQAEMEKPAEFYDAGVIVTINAVPHWQPYARIKDSPAYKAGYEAGLRERQPAEACELSGKRALEVMAKAIYMDHCGIMGGWTEELANGDAEVALNALRQIATITVKD